MIDFVKENWIEISAAIGGIVTAASVIVKLTPTPKDDKIMAKIIQLLRIFAIDSDCFFIVSEISGVNSSVVVKIFPFKTSTKS